MESKPTAKRGTLIFLLIFLVVAGAIAATVLLANDRRNLKYLLREAGFQVTREIVIPRPGTMEKYRGKRLGGVAALLPDNIFLLPVAGKESAFLRNLQKDGKELCALFARSGFKMTPWEAGGFSRSILECSSEETIANPEKPTDPSTFFLIVKGTADGLLYSARVKFIFTEQTSRKLLSERAARFLDLMAEATGWRELADERANVLALTPFVRNNLGVGVKFSSEFTTTGSYNLIIAAAPKSQPQKRTEDFFNPKNYYPLLPEDGGPPIKVEEAAPEG